MWVMKRVPPRLFIVFDSNGDACWYFIKCVCVFVHVHLRQSNYGSIRLDYISFDYDDVIKMLDEIMLFIQLHIVCKWFHALIEGMLVEIGDFIFVMMKMSAIYFFSSTTKHFFFSRACEQNEYRIFCDD